MCEPQCDNIENLVLCLSTSFYRSNNNLKKYFNRTNSLINLDHKTSSNKFGYKSFLDFFYLFSMS